MWKFSAFEEVLKFFNEYFFPFLAPRLKPLPFPPSSDSLESEDELLVPNSWEMAVRNRAGEAESEKT